MERTTEINSVFWLGTAVMLFLAFGLIFLVLFYQNYFSKMKRKEAEALLAASLESEKKERQRIAADLHDGICGDLGSIRNYLAILKNDSSVKNHQAINEIGVGIDAALENTRLISYKLMPPQLSADGFAAAVTALFERLSKKTGISFEVLTNENPHWPVTVSYELFRVVQEFTTNMLKYGNISRCVLSISKTGEDIAIEITDDGAPYEFANLLQRTNGLGLRNIESRLKITGAHLAQRQTLKGNHFIITLKNP